MAFFASGAQGSESPERLFKTSAKQRRRIEVCPGQCSSLVHIVTHTNNACVHLPANREAVQFYSSPSFRHIHFYICPFWPRL